MGLLCVPASRGRPRFGLGTPRPIPPLNQTCLYSAAQIWLRVSTCLVQSPIPAVRIANRVRIQAPQTILITSQRSSILLVYSPLTFRRPLLHPHPYSIASSPRLQSISVQAPPLSPNPAPSGSRALAGLELRKARCSREKGQCGARSVLRGRDGCRFVSSHGERDEAGDGLGCAAGSRDFLQPGGRAGVGFPSGFGLAFPSWGGSSELGLLTPGFGGLRAALQRVSAGVSELATEREWHRSAGLLKWDPGTPVLVCHFCA